MFTVYINYPNKRFSVHSDPNCGNIRSHNKKDQRMIDLNLSSLSTELLKFANNEHQFTSEKAHNDMWMIVNLNDPKLEHAVIDHVWFLLAKRYKPFQGINIEDHC
jgi:hypothetical protein